MTTPADTTTPSPVEPPADTLCQCGHPLDEHDLVASRYCRATVAGGLTRDCMCGPSPVAGRERRAYR
jgi:hypothetical protein